MQHKQSGFTAVEIMMTLVIAGVVFAAIASSYASASRVADTTEDLLSVNAAITKELQSYENRPFDEIPENGLVDSDPNTDETEPYVTAFDLPDTIPQPARGTVYISRYNNSPNLKYVFVRAEYSIDDDNKILEYGSLIQRGGVGR